MSDDPNRITVAYVVGFRKILETAAGVQRVVNREQFEAEYMRLYPGRRLPWDADRPTHARKGA